MIDRRLLARRHRRMQTRLRRAQCRLAKAVEQGSRLLDRAARCLSWHDDHPALLCLTRTFANADMRHGYQRKATITPRSGGPLFPGEPYRTIGP